MMSRFLAIFAFCMFRAMPSYAQFDTAEVLGTVRDNSGAVVPKAALTLPHVDTGTQSKTTATKTAPAHFQM